MGKQGRQKGPDEITHPLFWKAMQLHLRFSHSGAIGELLIPV